MGFKKIVELAKTTWSKVTEGAEDLNKDLILTNPELALQNNIDKAEEDLVNNEQSYQESYEKYEELLAEYSSEVKIRDDIEFRLKVAERRNNPEEIDEGKKLLAQSNSKCEKLEKILKMREETLNEYRKALDEMSLRIETLKDEKDQIMLEYEEALAREKVNNLRNNSSTNSDNLALKAIQEKIKKVNAREKVQRKNTQAKTSLFKNIK